MSILLHIFSSRPLLKVVVLPILCHLIQAPRFSQLGHLIQATRSPMILGDVATLCRRNVDGGLIGPRVAKVYPAGLGGSLRGVEGHAEQSLHHIGDQL